MQLLGRVQAQAVHAGAAGVAACVTRWPSRATACLLARLALEPQRLHPREELIDLLWPDAPPVRGRARLRTTLSQLRSLLEPQAGAPTAVLHADRHAIQVAPDTLSCDARLFEQAVQRGDAAAARALYAGELMPGHYDDWVLEHRRRLEALLDRLPPHRTVTVPAAHAVTAASAAAAADDGRGEVIGPLPRYWTPAFGHAPALTRLGEAMGRHRLVNLLGPGGSGKTRLASALVHAMAGGALPDASGAGPAVTAADPAAPPTTPGLPVARIVFATLADCSDLDALRRAMHALLRCNPHAQADDGIVQALQGRPSLLVLDNVEQLDDDAAQAIGAWLHRLPSLRVLMTSRRRLGLDGEQVVDMPALALPAADATIAAAAASPAVGLFVDRARASRPGFHLTSANADAVVGLSRLLGGMPLAIELAASRLRALQPRELLDRLRHDAGSPLLDLLARPQSAASPRSRHASMRQVVRWSWQQLPPPLADLLRAMAVFGAPATAEAATQAWAALLGDVGVADHAAAGTDAAVQALLAEAVDMSLLQPSPSADDARSLYLLPPPVREYALEQCLADAQRAVRSRLRQWLAARAAQGLPRRRAELQADLPHGWSLLLRARDDGTPREALALAVAMQGEWAAQPASPAVQSILQWAVDELAHTAPDALVSEGHYLLAALNQMRADSTRALAHAEAAIAAAPDDRCLALARSMRGWIGLQTGVALDRVLPELDESLRLARLSGDPRAVALILRLQASLQLQHFEDDAAAAGLLAESIRLFLLHGNEQQACNRQIELAMCWARLGRHAEALALAQACVQRCHALGLAMVLIYAHTGLGVVLLHARQPRAAGASLETAAALATRDGWSALLLPALLPLAEAWACDGHAERGALLLGLVLSQWPAQLGTLTGVDRRAARRTRRLLGRAIGSGRTASLMQVGAVLTLDQIRQHPGGRPAAEVRPDGAESVAPCPCPPST